jgi:lipopolysaccharide cholinephosphotransferase
MKEVTPELQPKWNHTIEKVLAKFIEICNDNHITYFGCGGTGIGAVRHQGWIPWDDDVDVIMPRPDYDRFIKLMSEQLPEDFELITPYNSKTYPLYFAKFCYRPTTLVEDERIPFVDGLYIDLFPIDGASESLEEAQQQKNRFAKLANQLNAISTHNTFAEYLGLLASPKTWGRFVQKTVAFFFRKTCRKNLLKRMDDISYRYDYAQCKQVCVHSGSYGIKEIYPKKWIEGTKQFTFEGMDIDLPSGYDAYLRHYFGDYMQLPPVEARVSHHLKAYFNLDEREPDAVAIRKSKGAE